MHDARYQSPAQIEQTYAVPCKHERIFYLKLVSQIIEDSNLLASHISGDMVDDNQDER